VAVDVQESPLTDPGVGEGIDDDGLVTEILSGMDGLDILARLEGGLDGADIVCAQVVVEFAGTSFRVDHRDPATQTEGDEQGRIGLPRPRGTCDPQPKFSFLPLCLVKL